jgi:hypothetical protein
LGGPDERKTLELIASVRVTVHAPD